MVSGGLSKNKFKVLTSKRVKGKGIIDPKVEILAEEYQKKKPFKDRQTERGESSVAQ